MWDQFLVILWAQSRITRNHFARTTFGTFLSVSLSITWYGAFFSLAVVAAVAVARVPFQVLQLWLPAGLLALFLYMQIVPLVTLSSGWSLQLGKLQIYPVSDKSLFTIEVLLRLTSAPEMLILLLGTMFGLFLRPDVFPLAPLWMLLFIPFNLLLQLAIRDFFLHAFAKNRFRELLIVLFLSFTLLPQILVRSGYLRAMQPYLFRIAGAPAAPWREVAFLSLGVFQFRSLLFVLGWIGIAAFLAFRQFQRSKMQDDGFVASVARTRSRLNRFEGLWERLSSLFSDPLGALIEKELRSLVRMPRFRVLFGMACVFSVMIFFPVSLQAGRHMTQNLVPVISLYGLLLLSDALLLNIFGFDRAAAQMYFVAPIPLATVVKAKNCAAIVFISLQAIAVPSIVALLRMNITLLASLTAVCSSAVATVYLLSAGNIMSAAMPRPIDPNGTFRRQAGAKVQMSLLACSVGMAILVGFAYLARWATDKDWVLLAVLLLEFGIGLIVYRIALESAINRAWTGREAVVSALSKNTAPVSAS